MKRIVVYPEELQLIFDRLENIEATLTSKQKLPENPFLDSQEFLQLMNISKRTAQSWRDLGIIPFSQVGSKIYYKLTDIHKLIEEHYINSKTYILQRIFSYQIDLKNQRKTNFIVLTCFIWFN